MNNDIGDGGERFINKGSIKMKVTKELQDIANAMDAYVSANNGTVSIVASFIAFDKDKLEAKADDIIVPGSDRIFAFGDLESLRLSLNELRDVVEDEVDDEGFVSV